MTLRLTVDTTVWESHVAEVAAQVPRLVPVVKGNGYGFGRRLLVERAAAFADTVAVGTVHELDATVHELDATATATTTATATGTATEIDTGMRPDIEISTGMRPDIDIVVLTPTLRAPTPDAHRPDPILTVASPIHVDALAAAGRPARVVVKLASSMQRYGVGPDSLDGLVAQAEASGLEVVGVSIHLPLAGTDDERHAEIASLLPSIDPAHEVWLSHLAPETYAALPTTHRYRLRLGTRLWHGDKSMLHLTAEVLDTRTVAAGDTAGYQRTPVPGAGTLAMIGAGTAHGVHPLPDGRSPFHHRRSRLALLEAPHMHTSMAFVPADSPAPEVGERVDVQRPLTTTHVDEIEWR